MGLSRALRMMAVAVTTWGAILGPTLTHAGGLCSSLVLSCENGRNYPLCPMAVSQVGEIASGHLVLGPHHRVHVRLVPMGVGYRYIGRGIFFEGVRDQAMLYLHKDQPIACTLTRE
jgi:hypothetical protein